jgi:hypothetical protein
VEYDLGQPLPYPLPPPRLGTLSYQPTGGDLTLVVRRTNLNVQIGSPERHGQIGGDTNEQFFAVVACDGTIGYDVLDSHTQKMVQTYRRGATSTSTAEFNYLWDLNTYLAGAYRHQLEQNLLDAVQHRIDYATADHNWNVHLTVNQVEGEAPVYQTINQTTADFEKLVGSPTPDKARLSALAAAWESQLAQANWTDKKAAINKKVGLALIGNLCAAYLLLEDYPHLQEKATLYSNKASDVIDTMSGALAFLSFEVEDSFSGVPAGPANRVEAVQGTEVKSCYVVKYSGKLAEPAE